MPKRHEIEVVVVRRPSSAAVLRAHLILLGWPRAEIEQAVAEHAAEERAKREAERQGHEEC